MQPLKILADNFVNPHSNNHKTAWYAWSGAALALLALASGLYFFYSLTEQKSESKKIYYNPNLRIILAYPTTWLPVPILQDNDGLPRRFEGKSGWFEVSATSGEGVILTEIASSLNQVYDLPFGANPQINTVKIAGQPGAMIVPTEDGINQAAAVITYPEPVLVGLTSYRFFIIRFDKNHAVNILNSLKFISDDAIETENLPNIMVYSPPRLAIINSPFEVAGVARTTDNVLSLRILNSKKQVIWTGSTAVSSAKNGSWGAFNALVNLSGAEIISGEIIELQVYYNPASETREMDKVVIPLQLREIKAMQVVEVYFGSVKAPSGEECNSVYAIERYVSETESLAQAAIIELLKGPNLQERQNGYFTSLPPGVVLNKLVIENGLASIDFNENLERGVGGSCRVLSIRKQIEKTLQQFPSVKDVKISINGRTEDILQP